MELEFYKTDGNVLIDGSNECVCHNGQHTSIEKFLSNPQNSLILHRFYRDQDKVDEIFIKMFQHGISGVHKQLLQFIRCNQLSLDNNIDVDTDKNIFNAEYVTCGYKSNNKACPFSTPGDSHPFCLYKTKMNIPVKK